MDFKERAISHIRDDIELLRNQYEENEIRAGVNSVRGQVRLLMNTRVITLEDAEILEREMGEARTAAAKNVED
ncbi:hypothetical protein ACRTDO_15885 [Vibrio furnissii]|uniref:hypothetical protein n=1 Tax=Vibrio furnissii TaxID=29494 RepID=UPI003D7C6EC7